MAQLKCVSIIWKQLRFSEILFGDPVYLSNLPRYRHLNYLCYKVWIMWIMQNICNPMNRSIIRTPDIRYICKHDIKIVVLFGMFDKLAKLAQFACWKEFRSTSNVCPLDETQRISGKNGILSQRKSCMKVINIDIFLYLSWWLTELIMSRDIQYKMLLATFFYDANWN